MNLKPDSIDQLSNLTHMARSLMQAAVTSSKITNDAAFELAQRLIEIASEMVKEPEPEKSQPIAAGGIGSGVLEYVSARCPLDITRHPLIEQAYNVCQAIEACGASPELTNAVMLASDLMRAIDRTIP